MFGWGVYLLTFVSAAILFAEDNAYAGAWAKGHRHAFTSLTVDGFRTSGGGNSFQQLLVGQYTEVGFFEDYMVGGKLSHAEMLSEGPGFTRSASGLVEAEAFFSVHQSLQDGGARAWRLTMGAETSAVAGQARVMGQDGFTEAALLRGFSAKNGFFEVELAARISTGADADQLRTGGKYGRAFGRKLVMAELFITKSLGNNNVQGLDFDVGQLTLSAAVPIRERTKLMAGVRRDLFARGFEPGTAVIAGLWWTR